MKTIRWLLMPIFLLLMQLLAGCASNATGPGSEVRHALAPTGKLRVGLYQGSPTSLIGDPASSQAKGVTFELGRELSRRLGVPFEPVVFPRIADVIEAMKSGKVDVTVTNASAARAHYLDFTPPVLEVEKGYLVISDSPISTQLDVDRPGMRIGVSRGSTSLGELSHQFKHATLLQAATLKNASEMLSQKQIDAFATNKAILFKMADQLPGSRVLAGRWGLEHFAIGIPKGRDPGVAYVRKFADDVKTEGLVNQVIARAGLRGTVQP